MASTPKPVTRSITSIAALAALAIAVPTGFALAYSAGGTDEAVRPVGSITASVVGLRVADNSMDDGPDDNSPDHGFGGSDDGSEHGGFGLASGSDDDGGDHDGGSDHDSGSEGGDHDSGDHGGSDGGDGGGSEGGDHGGGDD